MSINPENERLCNCKKPVLRRNKDQEPKINKQSLETEHIEKVQNAGLERLVGLLCVRLKLAKIAPNVF